MNAHVPVCCVLLRLGLLYSVQGGLGWLLVAFFLQGFSIILLARARKKNARDKERRSSATTAHCYWTALGGTGQLSLGGRWKVDFDWRRSAAMRARVGLLGELSAGKEGKTGRSTLEHAWGAGRYLRTECSRRGRMYLDGLK